MAHVIKHFALLVLLAILAAGCATTAALRSGERAEFAQDYDLAVAEYTKALQKNPDNRSARQGLERSKARAAENHFSRGRQLKIPNQMGLFPLCRSGLGHKQGEFYERSKDLRFFKAAGKLG